MKIDECSNIEIDFDERLALHASSADQLECQTAKFKTTVDRFIRRAATARIRDTTSSSGLIKTGRSDIQHVENAYLPEREPGKLDGYTEISFSDAKLTTDSVSSCASQGKESLSSS